MQQVTTTAYTRLNALHDHMLQLDVKKIELGQQKTLRELDQKQNQLAVEQRAVEEKAQQAIRDAKERADKERLVAEQRAQEIIRAQETRANEQRDLLVEKQIDREKKLAEQQIRSTEAWVQALASDPVS